MSSDVALGRRAVLAGGGALLAALAGCTGDGTGQDGEGGGDGEDQDDGSGGGDGTAGSGGDGTDGNGSGGTDTDGSDGGDGTDGDGSDGGDGTDGDGSDGNDGDGGDGDTADDGTTDGGGAGELDLREANVTGVSLSGSGGEYRVSTTLIHDDEGESGYANWWQVETLDGDRLGRRELAHPHGTREFTRSETVTIDADRVVVRGHDQTHGYGGQAAVVSVPDGAVELVRQGPEPESLADR